MLWNQLYSAICFYHVIITMFLILIRVALTLFYFISFFCSFLAWFSSFCFFLHPFEFDSILPHLPLQFFCFQSSIKRLGDLAYCSSTRFSVVVLYASWKSKRPLFCSKHLLILSCSSVKVFGEEWSQLIGTD